MKFGIALSCATAGELIAAAVKTMSAALHSQAFDLWFIAFFQAHEGTKGAILRCDHCDDQPAGGATMNMTAYPGFGLRL